ncbi:MFS transporter [Enterovirga sp. DB1703]|uniref:MFS transporter n=2 Tax=Enterovirga aerilata TaxID=2730920 RepID=A0A849ILN2_9HYPH|nr:MFS transporter [Enterovirga sp. DB1703]
MAVLDGAVANVALPTIAREFRVDSADAIWIVNAYQLAVVVSLLPFAALGEIVGYARIYLIGLALFTLASLACALSSTLLELTAARILQGFGAAGIMAINAALVRFTYPARLLGRGIGLNAFVVSLASAVGPTVAAAILATASWQWLFAINVPIGIVTFAIAVKALPRTVRTARRFDFVSALLNALAFGLVIAGIDLVMRSPNLPLGLGTLACGVAAAAALAVRELNRTHPLLPLDLLRIPVFGLSVATSICSFCAQMLALVSLPFHFEGTLGRTAVETGLLLTPWPIAIGIVGPIAGRLSDRYPAAILGGTGLLLLSIGLALLALMPDTASSLDIGWRMVICGIGFGLFQAPNNRAMISAAPRTRSGAAGGMLATARLTGQTLGATLVAIFLTLSPTGGETISLAVGAALALLGAAASVSRLPAELRARA